MGRMLTHFTSGEGVGSVSFIELELMKGGGASEKKNNQTAYNLLITLKCW